MGLVSLLFSFKGRINRAQYWLGSLGVGFGAGLLAAMAFVIAMPDPVSMKSSGAGGAMLLVLLLALVMVLAAWCGMAIQIKRFHDRGQSGLWSLLPIVPMLGMFSALVSAIMSGATPAETGAALQPYVLAMWAVNIGFFINLGCLPGTDGANKYDHTPGPSLVFTPRTPASGSGGSIFGNAEQAIERAIAEQARAAPAPAAAGAGSAPAKPASFGRRAAR